MDVIAEIAALVPDVGELLDQPDVTEVLVNANGSVYTERGGQLFQECCRIASLDLEPAVQRIARFLGKDVSERSPLVEARLPDGSRVAAAFPPVSKDGISLAIRRFPKRYSLEELVERGALDAVDALQLQLDVQARRNILISGGTGTGKTTLLNALLASIPPSDRLVIIEDVAEIYVGAERQNVVQLEAFESVTVRDCLKHALRQRPDRIIVGEVRGASAYDLLEAWNTGHFGSLATIHADRAEMAPRRLRNQAMQAGVLAGEWVESMINDTLHVVVHLARDADGHRRVAEIRRSQ